MMGRGGRPRGAGLGAPCRGGGCPVPDPCAIRGFPGRTCRSRTPPRTPTHPHPLRPAGGLGPRAGEPGRLSRGPGAGVGGNMKLMQPGASFFCWGGRTAGPGWTRTFAARLRMGKPAAPDWGIAFLVLISQINYFLTCHGPPGGGGGGHPAMPHSALDTPKCPLCWLAWFLFKWFHFPLCVSRPFPLLSPLNHLIERCTHTHTAPHPQLQG